MFLFSSDVSSELRGRDVPRLLSRRKYLVGAVLGDFVENMLPTRPQ